MTISRYLLGLLIAILSAQAGHAQEKSAGFPPGTAGTRAASSSGDWVHASAPPVPSPPPEVIRASMVPGQDQQTAPSSSSRQFASSGGPSQGTMPGPATRAQDGVEPLPPLVAPGEAVFQQALQMVAPFTPEQIRTIHGKVDATQRAIARPEVRTVPELRSLTVNLSPGAPPPILRTMPGEQSALVFLDATGAPWPLAAKPRISNERLFSVDWLGGSHVVVISALTNYDQGNLTVFLANMNTPIIVKLVTGEADSSSRSRHVDYRLDLRIPGRGPNAQAPLLVSGRIALYDDTMQAFLDGVPPQGAQPVRLSGDSKTRTQVWEFKGDLFVRTPLSMETAFDQTMAAADGTRVYKLAPTPYIMLTELGHPLSVQLDIN